MSRLTFKENCADLRNSRVTDIVHHHLQDHGLDVQLHDPLAYAGEAQDRYGAAPPDFIQARLRAVFAHVNASASRAATGVASLVAGCL